MLTSINPLGERMRGSRWSRSAVAFSTGSIAGGTLLGVLLGSLGLVLIRSGPQWGAIAIVLALAGLADLGRIPVPGPARQVNETWIGRYRDWVYGLGFGFQLGVGFSTFVVTWGTWAIAGAMVLTSSPVLGGLIGAGFGIGRAVPIWTTAAVRQPADLMRHGRRMARLAAPARVATAVLLTFTAGVVAWPA